MRDPVMIARKWSEKAREADDYYDRFVFLWFALNDQVRCNLFHGNKLFGRDSDDQVVRHGAMALERVVELLVGE